MSDKMREAFDSVRADEDLKERTRDFLARETRDYGRRPAWTARRLVPALVCLALVLVVGLGGWGSTSPPPPSSVWTSTPRWSCR